MRMWTGRRYNKPSIKMSTSGIMESVMVKNWRDLYTVDKSTKIGKRSVCGPLIDFTRGAQNFHFRNTPKSEDIILSLAH